MPILLTAAQRHELDTRGWFVVERVLQGAELERVSAAFDEVADRKRALDGLDDGVTVSWRNGLARHPDIMDLLDHERILSLVVDILGWNIQNRDSIFICTTNKTGPKRTASGMLDETGRTGQTQDDELHLGWHFDYEEEFRGTTVDGRMPLLDLKASWFLSDHTDPGHSTTLLVPGSFSWDPEQRATWQSWLDPSEIVAVRAPAGSVVVWRPTTLHAVLPHSDDAARKALHISYGPRWLRQSIPHRSDGHVAQEEEVLEASWGGRKDGVRQQLLQGFAGDMGSIGS